MFGCGCPAVPVLAGALEPVPRPPVRSRSSQGGGPFRFAYSTGYLARPDAVGLYAPKIPLVPDRQGPRASKRSTVVAAAADYGVTSREAAELFDRQVDIIRGHWRDAADEARLTQEQAARLFGVQILNEYALT